MVLQSFIPPILRCFLSLTDMDFIVDISVGAGHPMVSCFLYFNQLSSVFCKMKLFW